MHSILLFLGVAISLTAAQRSIEDECSNPSAFLSCMATFNETRSKCISDDKVCECEEKLGVQGCGFEHCPEIAFPVSDTLASYCRVVPSGCGGGIPFTGRCSLSAPSRTATSETSRNTGTTGADASATSAPGDSEDSADDNTATSKGSGDMLSAPVGGFLGSLLAIAALL
ncbi:hypothetical protein V496_06140 [Pseudogymnoascus sp. VKM F-4515 (FW-2607)]|nr:hypothetical protein V496_06140 [Pseudogymnoascus sp. VKM F-4515 (FW-2607)]KFY94662.1 hypothetical protein V498_03804 [Pseudogymnoascus sp. VKM F-4517 (FW-2822)]